MTTVTGRMLYHVNFYDGPRSGAMVSPEFGRLWFEVDPSSEGRDSPWSAWFLVYELTDLEWTHENDRHACFQRYVGTHCDYDAEGKRDRTAMRPNDTWPLFYRRYPPGSREDYPGDREPFGLWDPYLMKGES